MKFNTHVRLLIRAHVCASCAMQWICVVKIYKVLRLYETCTKLPLIFASSENVILTVSIPHRCAPSNRYACATDR